MDLQNVEKEILKYATLKNNLKKKQNRENLSYVYKSNFSGYVQIYQNKPTNKFQKIVWEFCHYKLETPDFEFETLIKYLDLLRKDEFNQDHFFDLSTEKVPKQILNEFNVILRHKILQKHSNLRFKDFEQSFKIARNLNRKFKIYVGPTNSGKTYNALQRAKQFETFSYLAPLRLLALEKFEELNSEGIRTDLITGEEVISVVGSKATSQTIETANYTTAIDCVVIDEFQMLLDSQRGASYTNAVLGIPAKEVILVGSKEALPLVEKVLEKLGETFEIFEFERKNPLEKDNVIESVDDLQAGDCLVAFSRNACLGLKNLLESHGVSNSVVYGALPPEVRKAQAKLFRENSVDVLIATDAISMGLNLPIKRIIFTELTKFNGQEMVEVSTSHFAQIIGRAGRYGLNEYGYFTSNFSSYKVLNYKFKEYSDGLEMPLNQKLYLKPSFETALEISKVEGTDSIFKVYQIFYNYTDFDEDLYALDNSYNLEMLKGLDELNTNIENKFKLNMAYPTSADHTFITQFGVSKTIPFQCNELFRCNDLLDLERASNVTEMYLRLAKIFPDVYIDKEIALQKRVELNESMIVKLDKSNIKNKVRYNYNLEKVW